MCLAVHLLVSLRWFTITIGLSVFFLTICPTLFIRLNVKVTTFYFFFKQMALFKWSKWWKNSSPKFNFVSDFSQWNTFSGIHCLASCIRIWILWIFETQKILGGRMTMPTANLKNSIFKHFSRSYVLLILSSVRPFVRLVCEKVYCGKWTMHPLAKVSEQVKRNCPIVIRNTILQLLILYINPIPSNSARLEP